MKVLLVNGSAHEKGSTAFALGIIAKKLKEEGIDGEIFNLGGRPVHGCIGCFTCKQTHKCVFQDDVMPSMLEKMQGADGIIIGTPVYYAGPSGALCAVLDRLFFSGGKALAKKPAAAVAICRRAGATASIDRLNKYFAINQMPIVSSTYWNLCIGRTPEDVAKDEEGIGIMTNLAANMAQMLKALA